MRLPSDVQFRETRLSLVPIEWRETLAKSHESRLAAALRHPAGIGLQSEAIRNSNLWLLDITQKMGRLRIPVSLSEAELRDFAQDRVKDAMSLTGVAGGLAEYRQKLNAYVSRYSITPPEAKVQDAPAIRRMTCPLWWRRALRKSQYRGVEAIAIDLGKVHKRGEIYASDVTVKRRQQQKRKNAEILESSEALNLDTGEVFQLAQLVDRSVANPAIRRGELMTRISGFESIAKSLGHEALFITLTTPSQYHRMRTGERGRQEPNPKWSGATPREGQQHLTRTWSRIRAALHRRGIRPYGFRIAEPHGDGTSHWHLLLFVDADQAEQMTNTFHHYALETDGEEAGAHKNRLQVVKIDGQRGSAAGYVAKYVSKNIDGHRVQKDLEGQNLDAVTGSQRVEAWASVWGIRQFQQIGGPPVGVWRELRRLDNRPEHSKTLQNARSAADAGHWGRFVEVMGGPVVKRRELPVRIARTEAGQKWDFTNQVAYPAPLTGYGEEAPPVVYGVVDGEKGKSYPSRRFRWDIKKGIEIRQGVKPVGPWSTVNNCTPAEGGKPENGWNIGSGPLLGSINTPCLDPDRLPCEGVVGGSRGGGRQWEASDGTYTGPPAENPARHPLI